MDRLTAGRLMAVPSFRFAPLGNSRLLFTARTRQPDLAPLAISLHPWLTLRVCVGVRQGFPGYPCSTWFSLPVHWQSGERAQSNL